jgi:hypothetical protein
MDTKCGVFDAEGKPIAFYDTGIHKSIPGKAIAISDEDWQKYVTGNYYRSVDGCTPIPGPAPAEQLATAKTTAYKRINAARLKIVEGGVEWNGYVWDSDAVSRNNLTGTIAGYQAGLFAADPETGIVIKWRTADNQDIDLTVTELLSLAGAMLAHINTQYQRSWTLKQQINAAATVEAMAAIIWT